MDFASLATAFTGSQLIVLGVILWQMQELKVKSETRDKAISRIDRRLAHVMGRMNIPEDVAEGEH